MKMVLLVLFMFFGCMKISPKQETESAPSPAAPKAKTLIHYDFVESSVEKGHYNVRFKFNHAIDQIYLVRSRGEVKTSEWVKVVGQEWTDQHVQPGEEWIYEFGDHDGQNFSRIQDIQVLVPQDLLIDRSLDINDKSFRAFFLEKNGQLILRGVQRLQLTSKGEIYFHDRSVDLRLSELISDGGLLASFPSNMKAEKGRDGKNGGLIELHALNASGRLRVELRGEDGGEGLPGAIPDSTLKGKKGEQGARGSYTRSTVDCGVICVRNYSCEGHEPGVGLMGEKGLVGFPGGKGGLGGATGRLLLTLPQTGKLDLQVTRHPGRGGMGGTGGLGGEGGEGGEPGFLPELSKPDSHSCRQLKGAQGPQGDRGPSGPVGSDGESEWVCEIAEHSDGPQKTCY